VGENLILLPRIAVRFVLDVNVPTYSTAYEIGLIKKNLANQRGGLGSAYQSALLLT
jgi:hypothetical protein